MKSKYTAEFIQTCVNSSPLLKYYAEREYDWRNAGKEIKKAIAELNFMDYFAFSLKNLNSTYFKVQRMKYNKELYAIVTNSGINYIFKIHIKQ